MLNAFICDGIRTPFGRHAGSLSKVRPDDMLGGVIKKIVSNCGLSPKKIDDVIVGCGNQAGEDSRCVARQASLRAGLPIEIPGTVIQRNCGSGLGAIISGSHAITCGEADVLISGGVESMTRAPFVVAKAEEAFSKNILSFDSALGVRFPNPSIEQEFGYHSMPTTADNLAEEFNISRDDCDNFAYQSQKKYALAKKDGFFAHEILSIEVPVGKKDKSLKFEEDEFPRPDTEIGSLANLRPINAGGVTTPGNSSGINDGAVALVMASKTQLGSFEHSLTCKILASGVIGVEPRIMGYGPVPASEIALRRAGLSISDMDVIEINEAFAAQVLACLKGMKVDVYDSRVNPNGGAISIGHPLGASGARIALTAARQLERVGGRYALVSMCIGMGQGIALVMERNNN